MSAGDRTVLFADAVAKVNRRNQIVRRLLLITDAALYVLEPETFRLKRRIPHAAIRTLGLSDLTDYFFTVHVPAEHDLLVASTRKTEIVTVLVEALKKATGADLDVHFANRLDFRIDTENTRVLEFEAANGGVSMRITPVQGTY
eukprot:SM000121S26009  [mRNA]  locus=s121:356045:356828:+ [translate_table: standard]